MQPALLAGYNGGAWNGDSASGTFTSSAVISGPAGVYGIGYADSADGVVANQPANTVEIRYTVVGDANLDGVVDSADAITMGRNYLIAGRSAWDLGNFNYDNTIDYGDALILQKNFNVVATLTSPAATGGAVVSGSPTSAGTSVIPVLTGDGTRSNVSAVSGGDTGGVVTAIDGPSHKLNVRRKHVRHK
jgi:hypothetical protein